MNTRVPHKRLELCPNTGRAVEPTASTHYQYAYSITITSNIRSPMFWVDGNGIMSLHHGVLGRNQSEYISIKVRYFMDSSINMDAGDFMDDSINDVTNKRIIELKKTLEQIGNRPRRHQGIQPLEFEYILTLEEIKSAGGVLYLTNLNLMVGLGDLYNKYKHPRSTESMLDTVTESISENDGTVQKFLFVDNGQIHGTLWHNTGYAVYAVKPQIRPSLDDGIYVVVSVDGHEQYTKRYFIDQVESELGLFMSKGEALARGDPDKRLKDMEMADKIRLQESKREIENAKIAREEVRDKASIVIESLKVAGMILGTLGGLITVIGKMTSS